MRKYILIFLLCPLFSISQTKKDTLYQNDIYSEYNLYSNRLDVTGKVNESNIKMHCGEAPKRAMVEKEVRIKIDGSAVEENKCNPLLFVNGSERNYSMLKYISPQRIQSLDVLKSLVAVEKYGAKAQYGAIIITLN
jgi:hypothetical protein